LAKPNLATKSFSNMLEATVNGTSFAKSVNRQLTPAQQVLIDYISQIAPLSHSEIQTIIELVNVKTHKKGKLLLKEGQINNTCYFVLHGCIRQYFLVDGDEKTTHFFTEGMPVSSTASFENKPSKFYLVCNEDCTVVEGRPEDEQAFFQAMPRMETLSRVGVEMELQKSQEVLAEYITLSPEERYLNLLQTRPDLLDRVPQYQLASFLGVTPESLSRIRKRIMMQ
jgi:CRP-like cAMP-binding protein